MRLAVISTPQPFPDEAQLIDRMVRAGLQSFHLRRPKWTQEQHEELLNRVAPNTRHCIILHHAHALVQPLELKGRHFTTRSRPSSHLHRMHGESLSASLHSLVELQENFLESLDYAFLSPVFNSISKEGYSSAFDLKFLGDAIAKAKCPILALGGIEADKVEQAASLNFAGVAALGAIWGSPDPVLECSRLLAICHQTAT